MAQRYQENSHKKRLYCGTKDFENYLERSQAKCEHEITVVRNVCYLFSGEKY